MAHVKAGGATRQQSTRPGKRLGLKTSGGAAIKTGQIILRQRGTKVSAGSGVGTGRDYTLFALRDGIVQFFRRRSRQFVAVK